jgi:serine/threonine protein kinase
VPVVLGLAAAVRPLLPVLRHPPRHLRQPHGNGPPASASPLPVGSRRTPTSAAGAGRGGSGLSERFPPGTVLLGRYRVLGPIGRGGMGEVYRADDLKLEQPVALKFLPPGLESDHERLERFYGEVRIARQVSHPAVCRVWDVGEAEGLHFLSMEYVDGENLSSLLRRIGRLPPDKALDIAKQTCAGLAAAHEKGVLHRDLKPANLMLDGQGKVRITDFGLAGLAESFGGDDVRSGTPSFMSPEQLLGREVTVRSDIYSLGLVLYELFTGRRAFEGRTLAELTRKHRDERPIDPSAIVPDLDPSVERTILACIEKDPRRRPPSASAVAAMLSGRDPLEAAIAAGDTPSPELVAAAGEAEALSPRAAWTCLGTVLLAALLAAPLLGPLHLINTLPTDKPPAVLEDRARELLHRLGVQTEEADSATGLFFDREYFRYVRDSGERPTSWQALESGRPAVLQFWYRQSPRPLVSPSSSGVVSWDAPPIQISGMAGLAYDLRGQLLELYAVPPQVDAGKGPASPPDWSPLFVAAGLDPKQLEPADPTWTPPLYADTRAAWTGRWPERPDMPIRVEAAGYRGRPVWFRVVEPWTRPARMEPYAPGPGEQAAKYLGAALVALLIGVGAVLARHNLVLGRGDRRGAFRLATVLVGIGLVEWLLQAHHVADTIGEMGLVLHGAGMVVLLATFFWLFYLALEPYVRRLRPRTLVSWTRLLGGGLGDAVVGRDALAGATWGALMALLFALVLRLPGWLGLPAAPPHVWNLQGLLGLRWGLAGMLDMIMGDVLFGLGSLLLYLILTFVLRRELLAIVALVGVLAGLEVAATSPDPLWLWLAVRLAVMGAYAFLLFRFGLLPAIVGMFVADCLAAPPLTTDLGVWYSEPTLLAVPLVCGIGLLAFRAARGGSGLRRYLAGEIPTHP